MSHYIVSSKPCSMTSRATRLLPNLLLSKPRPTARFARTMATTTTTPAAPEKCDWLVIIPDIEGALEHRMKIRPQHLSAITPRVQDGFWKMGGATLTDQPRGDEPLKIMGSAMVAHAATKEEVLAEIKKDIYAGGVWDLEKIKIYPFKTAFRKE